MKTSQLQGTALDWAVALAEGATNLHHDTVCSWFFTLLGVSRTLNPGWGKLSYNPSTDWSIGGPIIERENICIDRMMNGQWTAVIRNDKGDTLPWSWGDTPLIAAMRCYVASKLGDEVEIPEELR